MDVAENGANFAHRSELLALFLKPTSQSIQVGGLQSSWRARCVLHFITRYLHGLLSLIWNAAFSCSAVATCRHNYPISCGIKSNGNLSFREIASSGDFSCIFYLPSLPHPLLMISNSETDRKILKPARRPLNEAPTDEPPSSIRWAAE